MSARSPRAPRPRPQAVGCLGMEELRFHREVDPRQRPRHRKKKPKGNREISHRRQGAGVFCTRSKNFALPLTSSVADRRSVDAESRRIIRTRRVRGRLVFTSGRWPMDALKPARPDCIAVGRRGYARSAHPERPLSGRKRLSVWSPPRRTKACS